jgi:hypothetical protein
MRLVHKSEMIFTERPLRAFVAINFFAFLAKSNLRYTFMAMVRLSVPYPPPTITVSTHRHPPHVHTLTSLNHPQTGPVVGISFCLIIVRLGYAPAETQDETWHVSFRVPTVSDQDSLSFAQSKAQRDVYTSESKDIPIVTSKSQRQSI